MPVLDVGLEEYHVGAALGGVLGGRRAVTDLLSIEAYPLDATRWTPASTPQ